MTNLELKALNQIRINLENAKKKNLFVYEGKTDKNSLDNQHREILEQDKLITDAIYWIDALVKSQSEK
jgi:hypothetical protein